MRVDVAGQWFFLHRFEGRGRNQIRFEILVLTATRYPDTSAHRDFRRGGAASARRDSLLGVE